MYINMVGVAALVFVALLFYARAALFTAATGGAAAAAAGGGASADAAHAAAFVRAPTKLKHIKIETNTLINISNVLHVP